MDQFDALCIKNAYYMHPESNKAHNKLCLFKCFWEFFFKVQYFKEA